MEATMTTDTLAEPRIVERAAWLKARLDLLAEEKAFTRARDALAARRRETCSAGTAS
jgi:predicted dithiol-disulfide oxidoreductase (DUF899 family)